MFKSSKLAIGIWGWSVMLIAAGILVVSACFGEIGGLLIAAASLPVSAIAGLPALLILQVALPLINKNAITVHRKLWYLIAVLAGISLAYGTFVMVIFLLLDGSYFKENIPEGAVFTSLLLITLSTTILIQHKTVTKWMNASPASLWSILASTFSYQIKKPITMSDAQISNWDTVPPMPEQRSTSTYNKNIIKALITAGLILAMLIPAQFVNNLVEERQERQEEVTKEVSSKWAGSQTVSTPYLCIPYNEEYKNDTGRIMQRREILFRTANQLEVKAHLQPELRKRSIYDVLLYKSNISISGTINGKAAKDFKPENLLLNEAKLCVGISDFRGIEEKINTTFNDAAYDLEPGLPDYSIDKQGLSVPVVITIDDLGKDIPFKMEIQLKGSGQLHFLPLSDNSKISLQSTWPNPSFDGSTLPRERQISDSGFTASWNFNKANMPVLDQILNSNANRETMSFGVSMVQPADQYAKTSRSIKYAILFVGLTFAMFFILELLQKKNVHPVQYLLIGLALIIFYTLLLSISEYLGFNIGYAVAAGATISLVGVYAGSLFASVKTGIALSIFMGLLYGFIYLLIQMEDTGLLAGSIGLFIILAIAMYFSRRINWYGNSTLPTALAT